MPGNLYQCHCLAHDDRFCLHSRRAQEAAGDSRLPIRRTRGCFTSSCTPFMPPVGSINLSGPCNLRPRCLLITQRHAPVGAALAAPILVTILVFCWSTGVVPTAIVVTLMSVGLLALILWDMQRWKALLGLTTPAPRRPPVQWSTCGSGAVAAGSFCCSNFGNTAITGQVYRPLGAEWSNPSFIVLLMIAVFTCGDLRSGLTAGQRLSVLERVEYTRAVERRKP